MEYTVIAVWSVGKWVGIWMAVLLRQVRQGHHTCSPSSSDAREGPHSDKDHVGIFLLPILMLFVAIKKT